MKHLKRLLALMLAVLMLVSVAACGETSSEQSDNSSSQNDSNSSDSSSEEGDKVVEGGTLVFGHNIGVTSVDATQVAQAFNLIGPAIERLGRIAPNSDYEYLLAEDMIRDDDANTVTIIAKKGVKFHDGSELNGEVIKWNIDRYINGPLKSNIGSPIKCELDADGNAVVYFESYSIDWEFYLCCAFIYSKEYYEENGEDCYADWMVGTGPFKITSYVVDSKVEFERFEDYHGEKAHLDKVVLIYFSDALGQVTAFINNEIGVINTGEANYMEMIEEQGYEKADIPANAAPITVMYFNTKLNDPWADKNVRQAVALYGIDFKEAAYAIKGEYAFHTYQYAKEGGLAWNPEKENTDYGYDKEKALQMLSDAGYPEGFSTTVIAHTGNAVAATVIQSALKNLNIASEVTLAQSVNTIRDEGKTSGVYLMGFAVVMDQTQPFTGTWGRNGAFTSVWSFTDEADGIYDRMIGAKSREDKIKAMQDWAEYLVETETYLVPVCYTESVYYVQDYIHEVENSYEFNCTRYDLMWMDGKMAGY